MHSALMTMDTQTLPCGSQGERAISEEGMWSGPVKGPITGLCLKGESDKGLGVWTGLWMSEGLQMGARELETLLERHGTRGRTGSFIEAMVSRERFQAGKRYHRGTLVPGSRKDGN